MSHISTGIRKILEIPFVYNLFQTLHGGNKKRKEHFESFFSDKSIKSVLDIGCGTGVLLEHLDPSVEYHGCDMEESYISYAQEKFKNNQNAKFYLERVGEKIREDWINYFDVINAHGLLHHLSNDDSEELLKIAKKYLKPGGFLLTLDTVYYDGQGAFSKWIVSKDRGQNIRTIQEYNRLANKHYSKVETSLVKKHNRLHYSVYIMKMIK